jgi:hypothetical protein
MESYIRMGEKALWDNTNMNYFCDLCKVEVLNKVGWKNVEDKFMEKTRRKLKHLQFRNKWDSLKISYTSFIELKKCCHWTWVGWSKANRGLWWCMVARAPSWKCHNTWIYIIDSLDVANLLYIPLQRSHDPVNGRKYKHAQFRKCGPANLESINIMFGSAHVTGAIASTLGNLSNDCSANEEVHSVEDDVMLATLHKKNKRSIRPIPLLL